MAPPATASSWILVHIITQLELGGAQRTCLAQLARAQLGEGARYLLAGSGGALDAEARRLPNVRRWEVPELVRTVRPRQDVRALAQLTLQLRRIRRRHPHRRMLVHTHSSKAGILGRLAARAAGADRIVHTTHGFGHQPHMAPLQFAALALAERAAASVTDGFVWVAQANLHRARAEGLLAASPWAAHALVRPGIDVMAFAARQDTRALARELRLAASTPLILTVACMKPQKDLHTWVQVVARVHAARPDAVFALAGDGELRTNIVAALEQAKLMPHVRLLGWRHDVPALMQRAQLLLHTALWEGLPQVMAQAMAAGLPVVATRVDGVEEAIVDGVAGLLAGAGDVKNLSRACIALLQAPGMAHAMGAHGRARCHNFGMEAMVRDLDAFYAQLTA